MDEFTPSSLKSILHSKRANIYYLERCRVLVNGGRVEYVTEAGRESQYWNIPIANTTTVLLGTGTSITQAAMRELAKAGVLVGFCGGGGTPFPYLRRVPHLLSSHRSILSSFGASEKPGAVQRFQMFIRKRAVYIFQCWHQSGGSQT